MRDNLEKVTEWILVHEGGYVNHPSDRGGATNMGVTQGVYDAWLARQGQPHKSVKRITKKEVIQIYKDQYWDKVWGDDLPNGMDYALYDFAINSGPTRAIEFIQELVGVEQDGVMGNITFNAIISKNIEQLIMDLCFTRWAWLKRLRNWKTFGKGWTRRVMGEMEGMQVTDHGVIDRSVLLWKKSSDIPGPKDVKDGSGEKTWDEPLKRTEQIKEGVNLENIAKIGAGSLPAFMTAAATLPDGPLQWSFAMGGLLVMGVVAMWLYKSLR